MTAPPDPAHAQDAQGEVAGIKPLSERASIDRNLRDTALGSCLQQERSDDGVVNG